MQMNKISYKILSRARLNERYDKVFSLVSSHAKIEVRPEDNLQTLYPSDADG